MKTLALIIFSTLSFFVNAQTANTNPVKEAKTTTVATAEKAELLVSIPMIGNITLKNCDTKMQEALEPFTLIKVIKIDEIKFYELLENDMDTITTVAISK